MSTLSVIFLTRNCASRLPFCIKPWLWAKEVIVVDQFSTDETAKVAKELGCRVIQRDPPEGNFDLNRKHGLEVATGQWLLYLDSDEVATAEMVEEVKQIVKANNTNQSNSTKYSGYKIPNYFYFLGRQLRYGIYNPKSAELRLFQQGQWQYPCEKGFHHSVSLIQNQKPGVLQHGYKHFNVNSLSEWFIKTNQYTELDASKAEPKSWLALYEFIKFFLKYYFYKRGFLDGFHGLVATLYFGLYHFTLKVKAWDLAQRKLLKEGEHYLSPFSHQSRTHSQS